jgi:hypothetical protein
MSSGLGLEWDAWLRWRKIVEILKKEDFGDHWQTLGRTVGPT